MERKKRGKAVVAQEVYSAYLNYRRRKKTEK